MPRWVGIIYRIIGGIGIKILGPGGISVSLVGVLLEEATGVGIVVAGAQVGQAVGVWGD